MALADLKILEKLNEEAHILFDRAMNDDGAKYAALVSKALLYVDESRFEPALQPLESAMALREDPQVQLLHAQLVQAIKDQAANEIQ